MSHYNTVVEKPEPIANAEDNLVPITTMLQATHLRKGNVLIRRSADKVNPESGEKEVRYNINAINPVNGMAELVVVEEPLIVWLSPGKRERTFLKIARLVEEGCWWLQS